MRKEKNFGNPKSSLSLPPACAHRCAGTGLRKRTGERGRAYPAHLQVLGGPQQERVYSHGTHEGLGWRGVPSEAVVVTTRQSPGNRVPRHPNTLLVCLGV